MNTYYRVKRRWRGMPPGTPLKKLDPALARTAVGQGFIEEIDEAEYNQAMRPKTEVMTAEAPPPPRTQVAPAQRKRRGRPRKFAPEE